MCARRRVSFCGRGFDVGERVGFPSDRLVVQTDIQIGVKLRRRARTGRRQHLLRSDGAAEHLVDLAHRNAGVRSNRQQGRSGLLHRFRARHAEKMPGCVFHVVRVHGAVPFELRATVAVAARVIQRDARCQSWGASHRRQFRDVVELATDSAIRPPGVRNGASRAHGRRRLCVSRSCDSEHCPEGENVAHHRRIRDIRAYCRFGRRRIHRRSPGTADSRRRICARPAAGNALATRERAAARRSPALSAIGCRQRHAAGAKPIPPSNEPCQSASSTARKLGPNS